MSNEMSNEMEDDAAMAEVGALREFVQQFADEPCVYRDACPTFGSRHGTCLPCQARAALSSTRVGGEP